MAKAALTDNAAANPIVEAFKACRSHFLYAATFSGMLNILYLAPTLYMLQVYDRVVATRGLTTLLLLTVILMAALITLSMLDSVRMSLLLRASNRLDVMVAAPLLRTVLGRGRETPAVRAQIVRDFDHLRQIMTGPGIIALFDAPWTPIYIIVCFLLHPMLGGLALLGSLVLLGLAYLNERATHVAVKQASDASSQAYYSQNVSIQSSEVVRALGMRNAMVQRHLSERWRAVQLQGETASLTGGYMAVTKFVRLALQSIALGVGAYLAVKQEISAGAIFAASLLVSRALAPIEQVLSAWKNVLQARTSYQTLSEIFAKSDFNTARTLLPDPVGHLRAEHVSIYNAARDGLILRDIDFVAVPGEIIALVGPSGAGKSTLLRILSGGLLPDSGTVRIDEADVLDWDREVLARHIGYMPQDPTLFPGTIHNNIARFHNFLGDDAPIVDAKVVAAAQAAGAHEMILHLPNGYDTVYGQAGGGLSAGQAQRVALARALYDDPVLVFLDEPNAHMDAEGEALLTATLSKLKARGATVIVSAHRTGILSVTDKMMVLRDGQIQAFAPREEILKRSGRLPPANGAAPDPDRPPRTAGEEA